MFDKIMKKSIPPRIPRRGDVKQYSLNQVIGALAVGIFVTFIFGTIFGLKIGSGSQQTLTASERWQETEQAVRTIPTFTPEQEAAWDRDMAARRAEAARQRSSYGSSYDSGEHTFDAYQPAAEDVARHWEQETGQRMSDYDVKTIQGIMKAVDDK